MATDHDHNPNANVGTGYEKQDLSHRGILVFFAFLFVATAIIHVVIWGMYTGLETYARSVDPKPHPMAEASPASRASVLQNPPMINLDKYGVPRLQTNDLADMDVFRVQEERYLGADAWEKDGVVHLPIEAAMKLMAQRGFPARANGVDPSKYDGRVVPTGAGFPGLHEVIRANVEVSEAAEGTQIETKPAVAEKP